MLARKSSYLWGDGVSNTLSHGQLNASLRFADRMEVPRARKEERRIERGRRGAPKA